MAEIPTIMEVVDRTISKLRPRQPFQSHNPSHVIILVLDLVTLFGVIGVPALLELLAHFQVEQKESRVRQILFALQKAKLIGMGKHGGRYWYWPTNRKRTWIAYAKRGGEPFNRSRLSAKVFEWRKSSDESAQRAYDWVLKGGPK